MGDVYEGVCEFILSVADELKAKGIPVQDMIDAQSFVWLSYLRAKVHSTTDEDTGVAEPLKGGVDIDAVWSDLAKAALALSAVIGVSGLALFIAGTGVITALAISSLRHPACDRARHKERGRSAGLFRSCWSLRRLLHERPCAVLHSVQVATRVDHVGGVVGHAGAGKQTRDRVLNLDTPLRYSTSRRNDDPTGADVLDDGWREEGRWLITARVGPRGVIVKHFPDDLFANREVAGIRLLYSEDHICETARYRKTLHRTFDRVFPTGELRG
jgi:hypothetical protein